MAQGIETIAVHSRSPRDIIQIVDDDEECPLDRISLRGSDKNRPISVEDYADELLLQRAIAASITSPNSVIDVDEYVSDGGGGDMIILEDRKGKAPIRRFRAESRKRSQNKPFSAPFIIEVGEPSNHPDEPPATATAADAVPAPESPPTTFCAICMESKLLSESVSMNDCSHMFCSDCISQYVEAKVEENVTAIRCPDPGCKDGYLEPQSCLPILPPEVFERWCSTLCESMVLASAGIYCPFKDCSAPLLNEDGRKGDGNVIRDSQCPHCQRWFCAQCKVPWHAEFSCEEFQKLGEDERGREDILLMKMAKQKKWQRCPKCKIFVEKTEGCMFMKCRCGYTFCYGCGTQMTVNHYCTKCRR